MAIATYKACPFHGTLNHPKRLRESDKISTLLATCGEPNTY
jgi:hypothetical protein